MHRDLVARNILVQTLCCIKITDFNLIKANMQVKSDPRDTLAAPARSAASISCDFCDESFDSLTMAIQHKFR